MTLDFQIDSAELDALIEQTQVEEIVEPEIILDEISAPS